MIYKNRGYLVFYVYGEKIENLISSFPSEKACWEYAIEELRNLIQCGYTPFRKNNRLASALPCGETIPGISYVEYVHSQYKTEYAKFNVTYPCIKDNKAKTKSFHIERGTFTHSIKYKKKLQEVIEFLDVQRTRYREHLLDNVLTLDNFYRNQDTHALGGC